MTGEPAWCGCPREREYPPGTQLCLDDYKLPVIEVRYSFAPVWAPPPQVPTAKPRTVVRQLNLFENQE